MTVSETQLLSLSAQLVAAMFGILILLFGWLGNKLYSKLESMADIFNEIKREIQKIDNRVTRLEERCRFEHDQRQQ